MPPFSCWCHWCFRLLLIYLSLICYVDAMLMLPPCRYFLFLYAPLFSLDALRYFSWPCYYDYYWLIACHADADMLLSPLFFFTISYVISYISRYAMIDLLIFDFRHYFRHAHTLMLFAIHYYFLYFLSRFSFIFWLYWYFIIFASIFSPLFSRLILRYFISMLSPFSLFSLFSFLLSLTLPRRFSFAAADFAALDFRFIIYFRWCWLFIDADYWCHFLFAIFDLMISMLLYFFAPLLMLMPYAIAADAMRWLCWFMLDAARFRHYAADDTLSPRCLFRHYFRATLSLMMLIADYCAAFLSFLRLFSLLPAETDCFMIYDMPLPLRFRHIFIFYFRRRWCFHYWCHAMRFISLLLLLSLFYTMMLMRFDYCCYAIISRFRHFHCADFCCCCFYFLIFFAISLCYFHTFSAFHMLMPFSSFDYDISFLMLLLLSWLPCWFWLLWLFSRCWFHFISFFDVISLIFSFAAIDWYFTILLLYVYAHYDAIVFILIYWCWLCCWWWFLSLFFSSDHFRFAAAMIFSPCCHYIHCWYYLHAMMLMLIIDALFTLDFHDWFSIIFRHSFLFHISFLSDIDYIWFYFHLLADFIYYYFAFDYYFHALISDAIFAIRHAIIDDYYLLMLILLMMIFSASRFLDCHARWCFDLIIAAACWWWRHALLAAWLIRLLMLMPLLMMISFSPFSRYFHFVAAWLY